MEIERKFTVRQMPADLSRYRCLQIEQGYLCTAPVVRIRRENDSYYLTLKGSGVLAHEECNFPVTEEGYRHLIAKSDGNIISKNRYLIPLCKPRFAEGFLPDAADGSAPQLTVELDVFEAPFSGLVIAEVEFPSVEMAKAFLPPDWFGRDVTDDRMYRNAWLSAADPASLPAGFLQ
jgi:adenylate cyclase